ncbi:prepilin peptidase [Synergistales bacterium]|nr:prepilin peptidase [Synergistales bacterium]
MDIQDIQGIQGAYAVLHVVFSGLLGACLGSFLNVVAHRTVIDKPWWGSERSVCESCGHVLTFFELIPVISWVAQRGRCAKCKASVSARYIVVELTGALVGGVLAWRWEMTFGYLFSMVCAFGFLLSALTDYESQDVFDIFAFSMGAVGILLRFFGGRDAVIDGLLGAAVGWGIFALIITVSHGGMGWGDACLMGGAGALLGWKLTLLAFYLGCFAGGAGVLCLLWRGKIKWGRGDAMPFVPYLAAGALLAMTFGPQMLYFTGVRLSAYPIYPGWPF